MENEEQSFWGSVTDTLGDAVDTVSDVADQAVDMVDTDHDGTAIDDVVSWGAKGAGTLMGSALGTLGGPGGTVAGAAFGYAAGSILSSPGEDAGDFISDALGTRDELPYGDEGCTDLDYKEGRQGSLDDPDGGFGLGPNELPE